MKRKTWVILVAAILAVALTVPALVWILEDPGSQTPGGQPLVLQLNEPRAMASFGKSAIHGVETAEPADLVTAGTSDVKTVSVLVGDNDSDYTVRTLKGYGSEMRFSITGVTPNTAAMIDIEEIHLRGDVSLAYTVYVNDVEVYGRQYAPNADGPNHAYFDISAEVVGDSDTLQIRLVNKSDTEVRFHRVWAISDAENLAQEQGIAQKMDVVLMLNEVPGNLNYQYLTDLVESYRCQGMYNIGLCWEIQYLQWGKVRTEEYLNNVITASLQTGATLYLGINSWWSGTPSGMDGLGGMWQDAQYQQVTYDHSNKAGRGQWTLTTPNVWGNTPWLSMNNDHYNQVRVERIKETVEYLQLRSAELALAGKELPAIHLYTENEPIYWPISWTEYPFNEYPQGVGDFSAYVIADAAADGILLDPTDGLDEDETLWMYRNLNTYISEVGAAMAQGAGYNYITVKDGVVTYPDEQMVNDSFTHAPIQAFYPNWDSERRAWENHVLDFIHFGGEWNSYQNDGDSRALDYLLAYGSYANINAERGGFPGGGNGSKNFQVLSQCYAYGVEGVVIYNVLKDSDQQNVINESLVGDRLMTNRTFDMAAIISSDFSKKSAFSLNNTLIKISNMRLDGDAVVPNGENGGALLYKITGAEKYSNGLRLITAGSFGNDAGKMEILVGASAEDLQSVGVYENVNNGVLIDPALYAGASEVYIQVRICGDGLTVGQMASLALNKLEVHYGDSYNGCTDGTVFTYDQNRTRCQIIAARADVERLLNSYLTQIGGIVTTESQKTDFETAYNLYAQGRYGEAFTAVSHALSRLLPADFMVSGYGRLGDYPVSIAVDGNAKVHVTLKEVSDAGVRFSLSASSDADVEVSYLTDGGTWSLVQQENGDWCITRGDIPAADGKVTFALELKERKARTLPQEFEARNVKAGSGTLEVLSQDPRVTDYCYSTLVPVSAEIRVWRAMDGTPKENMDPVDISQLEPGDHLQVKLNERGAAVEIYAWYGVITGTVVSVEEISLEGEMSNAFVTVRAEDGTTKRLEIGYDCALEFTGATGSSGKLALVESVGLQEGQKVTVYYSPYTVNARTRALRITD